MENYIEQVLFYARSNTVEKDYMVSKSSLKEIVNSAVVRNKESIVYNNIELNLHDLDKTVYTDSKWCIFILNQIIQNSIKYSKIGLKLKKKLCNKLDLGIKLNSEDGKGTEVKITFPVNSMTGI